MSYDFMDVNLDEAKELTTYPDGSEQQLTVVEAEPKPDKGYVAVRMAGSDPFAKKVLKNLFFPRPDDDAERKNRALLGIKRFAACFKISQDEVKDCTTWIGKTGFCILSLTDDATYGKQNEVKSFIAGA